MKTKFTLLLCMFAASTSIYAQQILNGGFENWSTSTPPTPTSWDSYDNLIQTVGGGSIPVKQWCIKDTAAANVYAGSSSCRLMTDSTSSPIGKVPGTVANGTLGLGGNGAPYQLGWAFTQRPVTFNGALKFAPVGADTAFYQVLLTKWNVTGDSADIVGYDQVGILSTGGGYAAFTDTMQYLSSATPDTVYISFLSSLAGNTIGTKLWVDDLSFTFTTTGLVHLSMEDAVKVYPNPASSFLNVTVDENMKGYTFEIYDINGRLVKSSILENASSSLNISELENATYAYRVNDLQNKMVYQSKFNVQK